MEYLEFPSDKSSEAYNIFLIYMPDTAICNCCKCCCVINGENLIIPLVDSTNYFAKINYDLCKGIGTCVEKCINEAIQLNDELKVVLSKENCIGCGACGPICSEGAISLLEGSRNVTILPHRRDKDPIIIT